MPHPPHYIIEMNLPDRSFVHPRFEPDLKHGIIYSRGTIRSYTLKKLFFLMFILILVLVACGGSDDKNEGGLEAVEQDAQTDEPAPSPTPDTIADASSAEWAGQLAYIQDDGRLFVLDFATNTSREVAQYVLPAQLYTSPDQAQLYYAVFDINERQTLIYQYTFADGAIVEVGRLGQPLAATSLWFLEDWSPDGTWAMLLSYQMASQPILINLVDPSLSIELPNQVLLAQRFWTPDNHLIYVEQARGLPPIDVSPNDYFAEVEAIQLMDLSGDEATDISEVFNLADITNETELRNAFEAAGYPVANVLSESSAEIIVPAGRDHPENGSEYCWEYAIGTPDNLQYMATDVYALGNLVILDDGSYVFMQVEFADCSFINGPTGKIVHLTAENELLILTEELTSIADRNNAQPIFLQGRYSIAPTQDYVALITTDEIGTSTTLQIVDIADGTTIPVQIDGTPIENISAVKWGH